TSLKAGEMSHALAERHELLSQIEGQLLQVVAQVDQFLRHLVLAPFKLYRIRHEKSPRRSKERSLEVRLRKGATHAPKIAKYRAFLKSLSLLTISESASLP